MTGNLMWLLLVGVALAGFACAESSIEAETIKSIISAAELHAPDRFRFGDLSSGEKEVLVGKILESSARPKPGEKTCFKLGWFGKKNRSNDRPKDPVAISSVPPVQGDPTTTFREVFKMLKERPHATPLVAGVELPDILALATVGRHHCTREELQRRVELCLKLSQEPKLAVFCSEANRRASEWCEKPISIESPFADLIEVSASKQELSREEALKELSALRARVNPDQFRFANQKDEQKRENFDRVFEILSRIKNRNDHLTDDLSAKNLLAFTSVDECQCKGSALKDRLQQDIFMENVTLRHFCMEAYERAVLWCRKLGFTQVLRDSPEQLTSRMMQKIADLTEKLNPENLSRPELLDWQNREMFVNMVKILQEADYKEETLIEGLRVKDLLNWTKVSERDCKKAELMWRQGRIYETKNRTLRNFLTESYERSVNFCRRHGLIK